MSDRTGKRLRTFIAIDIPDHVRAVSAGIQKQLGQRVRGIRWVAPENIHLTLKFLGDVEKEHIRQITKAMARAASGIRSFSVLPARIGAFPGLNRPRVVWVGIDEETDKLKQLHGRIEDSLIPLGFDRDTRGFAGHLTLGRVKGKINPVRLIDAIAETAQFEEKSFIVDEIILYKSDLKPSGAVYTPLFSQRVGD